MKFVYKQNYLYKLITLMIFSAVLCTISYYTKFSIIPMPTKDIADYHINILTVNSIFSGFALTNLSILLSITDDQLIKKLEGTDILQKRNIVIAHSIIFGSVSILISMFWVLKINLNFVVNLVSNIISENIQKFFFYIEIFSLIISILYFLLSIKKMIQLLGLIHVPRKKYSEKQIKDMKQQIFKNGE